jgi:dihydrolipoamide dehydrogenase
LLEGTDTFDKSLVIIGGGVIGVEFASVYATLGCAVTVVEAMPRILPTLDADIAQNLNMILRKKGVKVNAGAMVKQITKTDAGLSVEFEAKGKLQSVVADKVLVAIGRRPNTAGLFADGVEIAMERGRIVVNDRFESSMPGVYAIGDVSSKIQLAHVASAQGVVAAEIIAGHEPSMRLDLVPSCIYTSPEIASVGMSEAEATEKGIAVKCGKFMMHGNGKTIIAGGERGFIKVVSDAESGKVLGAQLMCERATDMLSEITTAIVGGMTVAQMQNVMRPHPTFNEGVSEAFEDVTGQAIHIAPAKK